MNQVVSSAEPVRVIRIVYGALFAGLLALGAVLMGLRLAHWQAFASAPTAGIVLAVVSVLLIAATLVRKIPARFADQAPNEYWAISENRRAAFVLWTLIESAGVLGWMSHILTGSSLAAGVAGLAMAWLFFFSPSRLENMGAA
jgi:hypothetical protein